MKKFSHFPIHTFFDKEKMSTGPSGLSSNPEKEKALKILGDTTGEVINFIFKPGYTRAESIKQLEIFEKGRSQVYILKSFPKETKAFFDLIRQFVMHTDIFGKDGKYDTKKAKGGIENLIKELNKTTGNKLSVTIPEIDPKKAEEERLQKLKREEDIIKLEAESFKNNTNVQSFAKNVFEYCVQNPWVAKGSNLTTQYYGKIRGHQAVNVQFQLNEQWRKYIPEYFAVIETMQYAMKDDIWGSATGDYGNRFKNFTKGLLGQKNTSEEYQKAIQKSLEEAIKLKRAVFTVWGDKNDTGDKKYETVTLESIIQAIETNPGKVNKNSFRVLCTNPKWKDILKGSLKESGLKNMAFYLAAKDWDSALIGDNKEVTRFFKEILNQQNGLLPENLNRENIKQIYSKIADYQLGNNRIGAKISEEKFFQMYEKHGLSPDKFIRAVTDNNPNITYQDCEKFQALLKGGQENILKTNQEVRKTISDTLDLKKPLEDYFPGMQSKNKLLTIDKYGSHDAIIAINEIGIYIKNQKEKFQTWKENDNQTKIIQHLNSKISDKTTIETFGVMKSSTRTPTAINTLRRDIDPNKDPGGHREYTQYIRSIQSAARLDATNYDVKQQIKSASEDTTFVSELKKLGYTPEQLESDKGAAFKLYEKLKQKGTSINKGEKEILVFLESLIESKRTIAHEVTTIIENTKNYNEARQFIAENTEFKAPSQHDLVRYEYIDKYFNTPAESRDYSQFEKVLTSIPPGEKISVKDIPGIQVNATNEYIGNISVTHNEGGGIGEYTLTDPRGVILAKNIPLENIPAIMSNAEMLNQVGCEVLTPYMELMKNHLGLSEKRSDSFDGTFTYEEQVALIQNLSQFLYGTTIQGGDIQSMIREFNAQNPNQNHLNTGVTTILRTQKHILSENNTLLTHEFQKQMKGMRDSQAKSMG